MIEMDRSPFLKSLLEAWQHNYESGGWPALFPVWVLSSLGLGGWLAWSLPATFWDGSKPEIPIAVMAGVLTFNGLTLALSWSSFGKIFEIIGAGEFSAFLRRNKLLSSYLVTVDWVHGAQVAAISATGLALFAPVLNLLPWAMKLIFGMSVAMSIYAVRQGIKASAIMQDLIWQKAAFDAGKLDNNDFKPVDVKRG